MSAMSRLTACLVVASVAALPVAAGARDNGAGGNKSGSSKGNGAGIYDITRFPSLFYPYGYTGAAGYVRKDVKQEPSPPVPLQDLRNGCPPGMDCAPSNGPSAG
jgi:hypothetical protein